MYKMRGFVITKYTKFFLFRIKNPSFNSTPQPASFSAARKAYAPI